MKTNFWFLVIVVSIAGGMSSGCKKTSAPPQLSLSQYSVAFDAAGGTATVVIHSNGKWAINNFTGSWLKVDKSQGAGGTDSIVLTAPANSGGSNLSGSFAVYSDGLSSLVTITQTYAIFPSYNTSPLPPDASGMSSTAAELTGKMVIGWNIGNTMEAPGGETGWGNPVVTQSLIDLVKQSGFNAIRIPCNWNTHANQATAAIDTAWLSRVKQVVQYCINDGMYVMLNIHYDSGWLDCTATGLKLDTVRAKQKALWEQIATTMRGFDEHLLFASANEPNATDLPTATVLEGYHQIFINAVRSTGGKNAYRSLIIESPSTSVDMADYFLTLPGMPVDKVPNKLIVEVHYYAPSQFCILSSDASWGKEWCFWGANYHSKDDTIRNATGMEETYVDSEMSWLKAKFVSNNIPVLIGEFDAPRHNATLTGRPQDSILSLNSRAHFFRYLTQSARSNGIPAFFWDAYYDLIDRHNNVVFDQQALDSLRAGAGL